MKNQLTFIVLCKQSNKKLAPFRPTNEFIAPMMIIERHRRDLRTRKRHVKNNSHCHYQGHIRDDHQSKVALSACDGLVR